MTSRLLIAALAGVSILAVAAGAYAHRNRTIAMNAWAEYEKLNEGAQKDIGAVTERTRAEIDQSNKRLYETAVRADAGLPLKGSLDLQPLTPPFVISSTGPAPTGR